MMLRALTWRNSSPRYSPVPTWRSSAVSSGKSATGPSWSASFHRSGWRGSGATAPQYSEHTFVHHGGPNRPALRAATCEAGGRTGARGRQAVWLGRAGPEGSDGPGTRPAASTAKGVGMAPHIDRRSFLIGGAALAGGLVLGAQASGEGGADAVLSNGPGRNGVGIGRPRHGGSLNIGVNAEEQGFNPATGRFDNTGFMYARTVFDPLMVVTARGDVVPYLAQSVIANADYTVWTVTARPGITFHDGTPLDGAALLQNIDAVYTSALTGIALKPVIASYRQSGPLSIQITTRHPYVTFPYTLAES